MDRILKKISFLSLFIPLIILFESCCDNTYRPDDSKTFFYDFENECEDSIWKNIRRVENDAAFSGNYVCECSSDMTYAFGFDLPIDDSIGNANMLISIDMMIKSDRKLNAIFAVSLERDGKTVLWEYFPLLNGFESDNQWYKTSSSFKIPNDVLKKSKLNCYVMNNEKENFIIDDFNLNIKYFNIPNYIDKVVDYEMPNDLENITDFNSVNILYSEKDKQIVLADEKNNILTKPLSLFYSLIIDNDTVEIQNPEFIKIEDSKNVLFLNNSPQYSSHLKVSCEDAASNVNFSFESTYKEDVRVLRSALIIPFMNDDFTIYRRNPFVDTCHYQNVYYLGKEGFSVGLEKSQLNLYHPDNVSSIQLDADKSIAYINFDYSYDHLLVRFELLDTVDYYIDNSATPMKKGENINSSFVISLTNKTELPRIMPIYDGYESAIIWTEHADWADIKTHRAAYFGSEDIVDIEDAVGGFAYYDIPVTKSVFYNNPDSIKNYGKNPDFPGLHSSIMNDLETCNLNNPESYFYFLKQLNDNGFEICLHTPEQNTSNRVNMSEALSFMKYKFASPSWIDHGYNNGCSNNREDMVCDGLDSTSPYYVYDLWVENGVKFPWNASLEDMKPFDDYLYDNNLLRPYPGFGDAFPLPRVMSLKDYPDILLWSTPCATEPGENWAWDYYFSQERLDKIVDFREILITHMYAPWVEYRRGFWEVKDGKFVAKDSFNKALERMTNMRDRHLLLPTTVENYMNYQQQLGRLEYRVETDGSIILKNNNNETIKGLSLISVNEMLLDDKKSFNKRKTESGDDWIIWFDMKPNERVRILNVNKNQ